MCEADRQLIRQMQEGHPDAFERFAKLWYPRIVRWVAARTSHDKVLDYTNGVWIHLTDNGCRTLVDWDGLFAEGHVNPNSLAAYLKTTTVRKVIDQYRVDNKHWLDFCDLEFLNAEYLWSSDSSTEGSDDEQITTSFRGCFATLPFRERRMLMWKWRKRTDEWIANLYQLTANNVRQRRHQMIKKLRECLGRNLPEYFSND